MYWINPNNTDMRNGCRAFYCDTNADVFNLPTSKRKGVQQEDDVTSCQPVSKGSSCMVIGSAKYFVLNSQDIWVEM
jgi:hypothetical protein